MELGRAASGAAARKPHKITDLRLLLWPNLRSLSAQLSDRIERPTVRSTGVRFHYLTC